MLLEQARNLANNLSYAFDTPTGIPSNNLLFANQSDDGSTTNGLATAGTLVMEWTRLSDLTGDDSYAQLTQKAEVCLETSCVLFVNDPDVLLGVPPQAPAIFL